jgi:hypothetical protein
VLSKLIESTPKIPATDVRLLLLHRYETDFGIFNHDLADDELDPLALIRMHPKEDAYTGSYLAERLRQYNTRHVWEVTKMSFDKLLELPRHMVMDILEYADQELRTRTKVMQDEANNAEARVKALQQQQHPMMRPPE